MDEELNDATGGADEAETDRIDDALRARLGRGVGATEGDGTAALAQLAPRFARARRRRQTAVGTGVAAAAVLVVVGVLVGTGGSPQRVSVEGDGGRRSTTSPVPATSTTAPPTTAPTTTAPTASTSPSSVAPAPTSVPPTTTPPRPTTTGPGAGAGAGATAVPGGAAPTVPPTAPAGGTEVLRSDGGTVTVTWTATSLTVDATAPAAGWTLEKIDRKDAVRVVVVFRRDGGGPGSSTAQVDARVEGGRLRSN